MADPAHPSMPPRVSHDSPPSPAPPSPRPGGDETLARLCTRAMGGDREAFNLIHLRLEGGLRRQFLDRTAGRSDVADDLSQRTWMAVWKAFQGGKYHPERAAISTFVYAVGVKVWLQHLRKNRRPMGQLPATVAEASSDEADPVLTLRLAELLESIRDGLKAGSPGPLTEEERWIVQEAARGESDRTLAKRLGVAPSTLNVRKNAALEKLRRFLASRGHRAENAERGRDDDE
ncbi:MAG: RNA polymerase sigma factor [Phycisphaerales bacterium]